MDQSVAVYDWAGTLRPEAWQLPAYKKYEFAAGELRNLYMSWAEVRKAAAAGAEPPVWSLYCDVLRLEEDVVLDRTTIIFARRIEVSKELSLVIDRSEDAEISIILYAQEVVNYKTARAASLQIIELGAGEKEVPVSWTPGAGGASSFRWMAGQQAKEADAAAVPPDKEFLIEGEPLRLLLTSTFQVATLLCTTMQSLSIAQLRWIGALAAANPDTADLSLQAEAMANNLLLQQSAGANALLVPFLDSAVYAESAKNLMDLLQYREGKWAEFKKLEQANGQWQQIIEDSIGDKSDQAGLAKQLEQQGQNSLMQAWTARSIAARLVIEQKSKLQACQNDFVTAVEHWAQDEALKEGFNIVMGIVNILKEVPAIVAGGPAFAAVDIIPAASGLVSGLSSIGGTLMNTINSAGRDRNGNGAAGNGQPAVVNDDDAIYDLNDTLFKDEYMDNLGKPPKPEEKPGKGVDKKAAKKLIENEKKAQAERVKASEAFKKSLVNAGSEAANVVNAALRIIDLSRQAAAMEATGAQILASIGSTVDQSLSSTEVTGLDAVTGGAQEWDILALEIDQLFKKIKKLDEIKGGQAYRHEFTKMIVKGKSLCEARLAVAKASFGLAELKLRARVAEQSLSRSKARIDKLKAQMQSDESLQQYAFNKVLDAKRSVYMALESYRRAFQYFTLADGSETPRLPSLLDPVDTFLKTVSNIAGKELTLSALKTYALQTINKQVVLDDDYAIRQLQDSGFITWTLRYDDEHFRNLARIRFKEVSVFVEFEPGYKYDKEISVRILTSGHYADKNRHKGEKLFVGPPFERNFEYIQTNGKPKITAHADIAPRFAADFFNPTPFTNWTISFNEPGFDLKKVKALKLAFDGDAQTI